MLAFPVTRRRGIRLPKRPILLVAFRGRWASIVRALRRLSSILPKRLVVVRKLSSLMIRRIAPRISTLMRRPMKIVMMRRLTMTLKILLMILMRLKSLVLTWTRCSMFWTWSRNMVTRTMRSKMATLSSTRLMRLRLTLLTMLRSMTLLNLLILILLNLKLKLKLRSEWCNDLPF